MTGFLSLNGVEASLPGWKVGRRVPGDVTLL